MSNTSLQEITLLVNQALIKFVGGGEVITTAYKQSPDGIYVMTVNSARVFGLETEGKKLVFIPRERIECIIYDVAKPDSEDDSEDSFEEVYPPQG